MSQDHPSRRSTGPAPDLAAIPFAPDAGAGPGRGSDPAAPVCFRTVLAHTIERLDRTLSREQLAGLADAFTVMRWEFPDIDWHAVLAIGRDPLKMELAPATAEAARLTVVMDSTVLDQAATGQTTLGRAFIEGRLAVRGLNPLHLVRFVGLINPLLASYKAAREALDAA